MKFSNVKTSLSVLIYTIFLFFIVVEINAQERLLEKLNRGVVAVKTDEGVFLSWRIFALDADSISFNAFRDGLQINESPISGKSNFYDNDGTAESYYHIEVIENGEVVERSETAVVWGKGYWEIPLQTPEGYAPNDASVADLDGDGTFEIVVKMENRTKDNSQSGYTDPVYLQAYEMNGILLWSIDLGINIRAGAHYTQFMLYDLNGDGFAELACKTAPGTIDGAGNYLSDGPAAGDDDSADYRNSNGYILQGPEYLTLFDGKTGAEISTVEYNPPRGNVGAWGDNYGNRVDRFLACVAYFDSIPSLVMARGYYTRTVLAAWDYKDGKLEQRWVFDSDEDKVGQDGNEYRLYAGQGAHSLTVGDVDNDGKDEIVYGAMTVDHDGTGLYTTGNNHGDASHLGDFLPYRPGLEYYMPSESAFSVNKITGERIPGIYVTDAATGETVWQKDVEASMDIGRALTSNFTPDYPGNEFIGAGALYKLFDQDGNQINFSVEGPGVNFGSWWDGDLQREVLNSNAISKWTPSVKESLLEPEDCTSNNGTKATPALSGDIFGDWREEVIWRTKDNQYLRIYTTTDTTQHGIYTLLQDPQYRLALTWQNVAYNQPPHPSFYIGHEMENPPIPTISVIEPETQPLVQIKTPVQNYEHQLGMSFVVQVDVLGLSDTSTVYLNLDDQIFASTNTSPYLFKMDTIGSGEHTLVAWGYSAESDRIESLPVYFSVDQGLPDINLNLPVNGNVFSVQDSITLNADAFDSNGNIDSVTYYLNDQIVAVVYEAPFTTKIENPGYGYYTIIAVATDNDGNSVPTEMRSFDVGESTIFQELDTGYCGFITIGTVNDDHDGYTGDGFANTDNSTGAGITWAVKIEVDGDYRFYWRYAGVNDRPANLTIGDLDTEYTIQFPLTESWSSWSIDTSEVIFLPAGVYEVNLIGLTSNGLSNIDYMQILAYSENVAQVIDCEELQTSTTSVLGYSDDILIFPMPASEFVNIKMLNNNHNIQQVSIFDLNGKLLMKKENLAKEIVLDISSLKPGVYLTILESSNGKKFAKEMLVH